MFVEPGRSTLKSHKGNAWSTEDWGRQSRAKDEEYVWSTTKIETSMPKRMKMSDLNVKKNENRALNVKKNENE